MRTRSRKRAQFSFEAPQAGGYGRKTGVFIRGQLSFEALLLAAAYFMFVALMVSAVAGQVKSKPAVDSEGSACRVLHYVVQPHVAADFSGTGLNFTECNAPVSAGGMIAVAPRDWR